MFSQQKPGIIPIRCTRGWKPELDGQWDSSLKSVEQLQQSPTLSDPGSDFSVKLNAQE